MLTLQWSFVFGSGFSAPLIHWGLMLLPLVTIGERMSHLETKQRAIFHLTTGINSLQKDSLVVMLYPMTMLD